MNCNTTHYRANSSSVPGDPTPGLLKGSLYAAALIALEWIIVATLWWRYPAALGPGVIYVALTSLMATFASTLLFTAALAHNRGYRLTSRRQSSSRSAITSLYNL